MGPAAAGVETLRGAAGRRAGARGAAFPKLTFRGSDVKKLLKSESRYRK